MWSRLPAFAVNKGAVNLTYIIRNVNISFRPSSELVKEGRISEKSET